MRYHEFEQAEHYPIALLMKESAFNKDELLKNYINPLVRHGLQKDNIIAFTLDYDVHGKAPVKHIKDYLLESLLPALTSLNIEYLYCADSNFFKVLTKQSKADSHHGYVLPCAIEGYTHMKVVLGLNYQALIYDPTLQNKLDRSVVALSSHVLGTYRAPGTEIIKKAVYPQGYQAIQEALNALHAYPELTSDIEAFSLRFNEAGIATIGFAPDQTRFVAFPCDYKPNVQIIPMAEKRTEYGRFIADPVVRAMLKEFFTTYKGKITWHNAGYDLKVIIYTLWMKNYFDQEGLLEGLEVMTRHFDDTKLIAYLATNSTAGNTLGLKPLAQEFAGNWAKDDIKDIRLIPLDELLQYNGVDCLSTWYVKTKYWPVMVADDQQHIYETLFKPSAKLILQMELTGMPMNAAKIIRVERKLRVIDGRLRAKLRDNPWVTKFEDWKTHKEWEKDFEDRRGKAKFPDKILPKDQASFPRWTFNPGSAPQLQVLLYEMMGFPVIDLTDTKQPATGEKTLEKLLDHPVGQANKEMLEAMIGISQASTILSTFIPAFKKGIDKAKDGILWLHGSFNLGGTVSGRLSSSEPNMQNIPAKSIFAKLIKECFMAPHGWLFCGADFNSLEDMISALTTKDPNKLKVYTDGYDGHSLRAAYYSKIELEAEGIFIDLDNPKSVNQLKKMASGKEHPARQESKAPTFALTYQGTWYTLVTNLGWTKEKAQRIETNYHALYVVSDDYVQERLEQASKDGYVSVAFGLRLRTPLLKQVIFGSSRMPYEAKAEGRTAGNALGQSYGLLNNRAAVAFWEQVWQSKYRLDILPCALIHDAIYPLIRDNPEVVEWANRKLIECMRWQELPEIQHDTVKLGANLDVFYKNWSQPITLPNNATKEEILKVCKEGAAEYDKVSKVGNY